MNDVVPTVLGGVLLDNGFWRFFSSNNTGLFSLAAWNAPNLWKHAWKDLASPVFWGEDVFGNQLVLDGQGNVFLWNHENASVVETGLDLLTIFETSIDHGLSWMDFYTDGSYALVKNRELPIESHWHWIQPRILGGQVTAANLCAIERVQHLIGHGQLWLQVRGMPPGSRIVLK